MPVPTAARDEAWVRARVEYDLNGGCWLWNKAVSGNGYGKTRMGGKDAPQVGAHTLSWRVFRGEIPQGQFVLHRCDNKVCVNPDHLFLGNQAANLWDMRVKGRERVLLGEQVHFAKIVDSQARHIKTLEGRFDADLVAEIYGVIPETIRRIWRGETFKHLEIN